MEIYVNRSGCGYASLIKYTGVAMFLSTKHNIILNTAHLFCGKKHISSQIPGSYTVQLQSITCVIKHQACDEIVFE